MVRRTNKRKKMTLSEHLAMRERAAKESEAREEARRSSIRNLRMLDKAIMCDCPACRKRRSML